MAVVYCKRCQQVTATKEPVMIKRLNYTRFWICGICKICEGTKYKFLNGGEVRKLPDIFFDLNCIGIPGMAMQYVLDSKNMKHYILPLIDHIIN
jgi:hypothetical protein